MLYLDFYHHIILVRSIESTLIQKLRDEFHFFVVEGSNSPEIVIELYPEAPPTIPSLVAVKVLETSIVYKLGSRQYVDYFGEALTIWDSQEGKIQIYSENFDRLFELGFLAVHSFLGQKLDQKGLCRIHAAAVSIQDVNAVVMLPSKGGKSTLLQHLLQNPEIKIISDDMPLVDLEGKIHPFPSKMSLNEVPTEGVLANLSWKEFHRHHYPTKWTASLTQLKDRLDTSPQTHRNLLIAGFRLSNGQSLLSEVPKWKMAGPLLEHMIVGMGLPQIIELFLKFQFTDIFKMIFHGGVRTICAFNLARKSRCYYFYLGPDKSYNSQLLLDLIYEQQNS